MTIPNLPPDSEEQPTTQVPPDAPDVPETEEPGWDAPGSPGDDDPMRLPRDNPNGDTEP
jgi:hypothetical protein